MTTWKKILAKERRRDTWAAEMRRKFERGVRELERLGPELEQGLRELGEMHREYEDLKRELRVLAAANEDSYRRKISEGTRRGLARARARGVELGGARPRKSKVNLNELRRLYKHGLTQQQIAERLDCSQALVSRRLRETEKRHSAQKSKKVRRGEKNEHLQAR